MKHLSLSLTVLLLGATPLAAAALDYGPNRHLLADEHGAPALPEVRAHPASGGAMRVSDTAETRPDQILEASPAAPRPASAPPSAAPPLHRGRSAVDKPHRARFSPGPMPGPSSWQSLLPGSIQ